MTVEYGEPDERNVPTVLTPRLVLRGWRANDVPAYLDVVSDPQMSAHRPNPSTQAGVWSHAAFQIGHWAFAATACGSQKIGPGVRLSAGPGSRWTACPSAVTRSV